MRALKLISTRVLSLEDVPDPVPRSGECLVRVAACGICGTDLHGYLGHDSRRIPPLILGHEAAGIVADGPRRGERVAINPIVTCMRCEACIEDRPQHCANLQSISLPPRDGAFAELVSVPEGNLFSIPDTMSLEVAALIEPTAVAWHAVEKGMSLADRAPERLDALVIGGGPIGLLSALVLKARGVARVTIVEPHPARHRHAKESDVGNVVKSTAEVLTTSFDLVIDAVGLGATRSAACEAARRGAIVVHLGLMPGSEGLDAKMITIREIVFAGAYCFSRANFGQARDLLTKDLGPLNWVEFRRLQDGVTAFEDLVSGSAECTKLVLRN